MARTTWNPLSQEQANSIEFTDPSDSTTSGGGVLSGSLSPNGNVTATGPAIYLQTSTSPPTSWFKVTSGTSNTDWV